MIYRLSLALAILMAAPAAAREARFDPRDHKADIAGKPTEIMVLATPHLASFPKTFDPRTLTPLLDRLAAWSPAIITIEALSGAECEFLARYTERYGDTAKRYCWDPAPAQAATGLTVAEATAEASRQLAAWPERPSPAERRKLAATFLAANDQASALVQWLRLPVGERRAGDGVDTALAARLETLRARPNENFLIAAALAARLGLNRVYPTDDHTADTALFRDPAYGAAIQRIWQNPAIATRMADNARLEKGLGTPEGVMAMYRFFNQPQQAKVTFDSDFGAALRDTSPPLYGRHYVSWWETRNLRMVANIRDAAGTSPGARLLSIVGASHKPYFDAYLAMMHDVRVVDVAPLLD